MPRLIPIRPAPGFDRTAYELVFAELVREVGDVITNDDARAFADRHGIHFSYVQDLLGLFVALGLAWKPRDGFWYALTRTDQHSDEEEAAFDRRLAMVDAYLLTRMSGRWGHVAGAWALQLGGVVGRTDRDIPGLPFCIVTKTARFTTERFAATAEGKRPTTERNFNGVDMGNRARHLMAGCGMNIAVATRPPERLRPVEYTRSGDVGVHIQQPAAAVVTMFEFPRLSGGYAAYRDAVLHAVLRLGFEPICTEAATATLTVRRRLAFGLWDAVGRIAKTTWWIDPCIPGSAWPIDEVKWWIARELGVRGAGARTLLDPHRRAQGKTCRELGVLDNRAADPTVDTDPRFDPEAFGTWRPPIGRSPGWYQLVVARARDGPRSAPGQRSTWSRRSRIPRGALPAPFQGRFQTRKNRTIQKWSAKGRPEAEKSFLIELGARHLQCIQHEHLRSSGASGLPRCNRTARSVHPVEQCPGEPRNGYSFPLACRNSRVLSQ